MPNWLNNLEPVTSHQEIKGAAQSDYSKFHLPPLYIPFFTCVVQATTLIETLEDSHLRAGDLHWPSSVYFKVYVRNRTMITITHTNTVMSYNVMFEIKGELSPKK